MASTSPIPGGTVLATVSADPNYRVNKLAGLAQAVGGAFRNAQAQRQRDEERELQEIQSFYTMAVKYPELAGAMGPQLAAKYGKKYPQVAGLVDVLANRQAEAQGIRAAGDRYFGVQGEMERKYAQDMADVSSMPDTVPVQVPIPSWVTREEYGGTVEVPTPNLEKVQRAAALSQVQPGAFPLLAEQALSPKEREQARLAGAITTERFDPFKDLPPDQRANLAATLGWLAGDARTAARTGVGLEQTAAKQAEQDFSHTERVESEKERSRQAVAEDERTEAHSAAVDSRARERMGYGEEIQGRLIDRRAANKGKGEGAGGAGLWRSAVEESKTYSDEWDDGLKRATAGLEGSAKTKAVADYKAANPYPARLSAEGAQTIAARVRQRAGEGVVAKGEEGATVARLVESYHRRVREGMKPSEALRAVLQREEEMANASAPKPPTGGMN